MYNRLTQQPNKCQQLYYWKEPEHDRIYGYLYNIGWHVDMMKYMDTCTKESPLFTTD